MGEQETEIKAEGELERLREAREERARRYGIAPKEGGHLTPPADYPEDPDQYGDPVNYKYPIDEEHIRAAITYFNREDQREAGGYSAEEWAIIGRRIARAATRLLGAEYEYRDGKVVRVEEKSIAVKIVGENGDTLRVAGWGVVFGGRDLEGDTFTPETDFWLDRLPGDRPVLYDHSFNVMGLKALGQARLTLVDEGLWVEAELDRHNEYMRLVEPLLRTGVLGWSTGAVAHLVRRESREGKTVITSWPIAEVSLTPTPADPRTLGVAEVRALTDEHPALKSLLVEADEGASADGDDGVGDVRNQSTDQTNLSQQQEEEMDELKIAEIVAQAVAKALGPQRSVGIVTEPDDAESAVKSFNLWLRTGRLSSGLKAALAEGSGLKAALAEGSGPTGGYIVPPEYSKELVTALYEQSILRKAGARVIRVSTNQVYVSRMSFGAAASIVSEADSYPEEEPTFAQEAVTLYKFGRLAKVSEELLADAMVDIWQDVLLPEFTQAFASAENTHFTTGTGSSQPEGFLTGGTLGKTAASASAITADEVIDLYFSLSHLYRQNAVWMMNDATAKVLRQLKDSTGQYLWQPGLQAGTPDTLLGRPVITNNAMPTIAASAKVIAFGDFRYFRIFESGDLSVRRMDEIYAAYGLVGFRAFRRVGSIVMLPEAIVYLQMASA